MDEANAIVRRLFERAAERVGSVHALARYLGLGYEEVRSYLDGAAIPPEPVLLRAVDVVVDDLKTIKATFSERAWQSLALPSFSAAGT